MYFSFNLLRLAFIIYGCVIVYSVYPNDENTNCLGCFNPEQGICLLNPDNTCVPFTESQCVAKGKPWQWSNTSINTWPTGCLSIIEAVGFACGNLLPLCPEANYYLPHADSAKSCGTSAVKAGINKIGFDPLVAGDPAASNCFAIKQFNAGCVWQKWTYYSLNKTKLIPKKLCGSSFEELQN